MQYFCIRFETVLVSGELHCCYGTEAISKERRKPSNTHTRGSEGKFDHHVHSRSNEESFSQVLVLQYDLANKVFRDGIRVRRKSLHWRSLGDHTGLYVPTIAYLEALCKAAQEPLI